MARLVGKMAPSSDASDHLRLLELKLSRKVFTKVADILTGGDCVELLVKFTFKKIINDPRLIANKELHQIVTALGNRQRVFLTNGVLDAHLTVPGQDKCVPIRGPRHLQARIGAYSQEAFTGAPLRIVSGKIHPSTAGLKPSIWQSTASGTIFPTKGGVVSTSSQLPIWAAAMFYSVSRRLQEPYACLNPATMVSDLVIQDGPFRTSKWTSHKRRRLLKKNATSKKQKKRKNVKQEPTMKQERVE